MEDNLPNLAFIVCLHSPESQLFETNTHLSSIHSVLCILTEKTVSTEHVSTDICQNASLDWNLTVSVTKRLHFP